jgi:outer membrane lipoprotein SlyB
MFKKVLILAAILTLFGVVGCTSSSTETPASVKSIRESKIGTQWQMKQVEINFKAETFMTLDLAAGDKVDGYFYIESGDSIGFSISGISPIYSSSNGSTSDRFSFTASQAQGIDYKLKFTTGNEKEATVFLEIIYPATGKVLVPFGTK